MNAESAFLERYRTRQGHAEGTPASQHSVSLRLSRAAMQLRLTGSPGGTEATSPQPFCPRTKSAMLRKQMSRPNSRRFHLVVSASARFCASELIEFSNWLIACLFSRLAEEVRVRENKC